MHLFVLCLYQVILIRGKKGDTQFKKLKFLVKLQIAQ